MPSIAAAIARPSASAGVIEPTATATTAPIMLSIWTVIFFRPPSFLDCADAASDIDRGQHAEYVCLHQADQNSERHEWNRHQQACQRQDDRNHQFLAHDISEQA